MRRCQVQRISFVVSCLLLLGVSARARSDDAGPAAELHWVRLAGAEDCISGPLLTRAVEARLQRPVFSGARPASVQIEGYAEREDAGYRAKLQMSSSDGALLGARELASSTGDCRELSETVTVVLAIMIDPEAAARGGAPPPAEPPSPPPPCEVAPEAEQRPHQLLAFARAAVHLLPTIAFGIGAAYERELRRFGRLRVEGVGFFDSRAELPIAGPSSGASFQLAYAGLAYCPLWLGANRVRLSGCLGTEFGAMYSKGFGLTKDEDRPAVWTSASASARLSLRLVGPLRAYLGAGVLVPFWRPDYNALVHLDDGATDKLHLFQAKLPGGLIDVGIGANLGR